MPSNIEITGGQYVVDFLAAQGVETVFCITGAGNLAIVDAFATHPEIKVIFSHHEQAAVMEAQGYSRISGKPGVALVTTGGGTSNVVTGVLSAQLDSVPVLVISGNESSFQCDAMANFRAYGVQGFDSVSVLKPVTKMSSRSMSTSELERDIAAVWESMTSGRQGAVHLDIPMDIQRRSFKPTSSPEAVAKVPLLRASSAQIKTIALAISRANRPVIYFGNGIRSAKSKELLQQVWDATNIPFFMSWSALDLLPESHAANYGRVGIYGDRSANISLQKSDLVLCVGTRLAIPQVGYNRNDFARNAEKWVIDCDSIELTKFDGPAWNTVTSDATYFLEQLIFELENHTKSELSGWHEDLRLVQSRLPRDAQVGPRPSEESGYVHSVDVMKHLNRSLNQDAVIGTDVGAALLSGHYALEIRDGQNLFTSQGLGEMGFGLPGTLGAYFADPSRQLICLNTDGAIMFNLQELQLIAQESIPVKLFIFNNEGYSMIKISQENLFDARYAGSSPSSGVSFPSFEKLAAAFNLNYTRVEHACEFGSKIDPALASTRAELIEIMMDPNQKYLPRLGTSKLANGELVSPPLEDLDPKIDLRLLEELLGTTAHANSYAARGLKIG